MTINDWREILGWPYTDWERLLELDREAAEGAWIDTAEEDDAEERL